jgi:hypothetical protein
MNTTQQMDWTEELAEQLDWWWRACLRPRMDELTDEEYREALHHGAEIALLRDLYRWKEK